MLETLMLNKGYNPIAIVNWQNAITLWTKEVADVIDEYSDRSLTNYESRANIMMPCIIRLRYFTRPTKNIKIEIPFNRENVYIRDRGTCQYCGKKISKSGMELEHVLPRSKGGKTGWMNIVAACTKCNFKKADRTPEQSDMPLIRRVFTPEIKDKYLFLINKIKSSKKNIPEPWKMYLKF